MTAVQHRQAAQHFARCSERPTERPG